MPPDDLITELNTGEQEIPEEQDEPDDYSNSDIDMQTDLQLVITCKVWIPNLRQNAEMTPKELLKFHDDLTQFINDNCWFQVDCIYAFHAIDAIRRHAIK